MILHEGVTLTDRGTALCKTDKLADAESERSDDATWLARGSFITLGGGVAGRMLGVGTQIALARLLGPAAFGLYAIGWTLLRVTTIFSPLGLDNGVIHCATRYATVDHKRFAKVLQVALVLAVVSAGVVGLLICAMAPLLAHRVFGKTDLAPVICMFAAGFPLAAGLRVASASTTVSHSLKFSAYAESLLQPASNLVLIFAFYLIGWRLLGAAAAAVISFGVGLVLAMYYEHRIFPQSFFNAGVATAPVTRELLQFSLVPWLGFVFINLVPWIDRLFVGAYLAPREVGVYQAAAQASVALSVIAGALNVAIAPRISLLHQTSQMKRLHQFYKVATKWTLYSTIPMLLVFCLAPDHVLVALYGTSYTGGTQAMIILSIMRLIDALAGPVGILLIFTARQRSFSIVAGCGLVCCIIFNSLLTPHFGAVGAALATGLANALMMMALLLLVRIKAGIWPLDARCLKGVLATGVAVGALVLARHIDIQPVVLRVFSQLALAATVFAGVLFLLGLDPEDREMLRILLRYPIALARATGAVD